MRENREAPPVPVWSAGRSEKPMRHKSEMHADGESSDCTVPTNCPNQPGDRKAEGGEGRQSAKKDSRHGPVLDTEPENEDTGAL